MIDINLILALYISMIAALLIPGLEKARTAVLITHGLIISLLWLFGSNIRIFAPVVQAAPPAQPEQAPPPAQ